MNPIYVLSYRLPLVDEKPMVVRRYHKLSDLARVTNALAVENIRYSVSMYRHSRDGELRKVSINQK